VLVLVDGERNAAVMRPGVAVLVATALVVVGASSCSGAGDDTDCRIPQPAEGDVGTAALQLRDHRQQPLAEFGGRVWVAKYRASDRLPEAAPAVVIAPRKTNWTPGSHRASPYPRLQLEAGDGLVLELVQIGCA
jgi:hypothetical protein